MLNVQSKAGDALGATVAKSGAVDNSIAAGGVFVVQCFDKDGNLKW